MPIHRLDSQPTRNAILGDITCDSDGKMDQFIDRRDVAKTLALHRPENEPYYLSAFLVGAYQEILGDLHNLFGDTNAVHIDLTDSNEIVIDSIIKGDTVTEVLHYVQFNPEELLGRLQTSVEESVRLGRIDHRQAGCFMKFYGGKSERLHVLGIDVRGAQDKQIELCFTPCATQERQPSLNPYSSPHSRLSIF